MNLKMAKKLLCIAVAGMMFPLAAQAADEDLQLKIDKLSKEVNDLKGAVKKVEDKSIGKWLTIGGEYRFRVDSLHGETAAYSDAIGTMTNMVNGFINSPNSVAGIPMGALGVNTPTGTAFIMQGKAGSLFTPAQFNTILNQYMPTAMYYGFFGSPVTASGAANSNYNSNLGFDAAGSLAGRLLSTYFPAGTTAAQINTQVNTMLSTPAGQAQLAGMIASPLSATQAGMLQGTTLTAQQSKVLATLQQKVMGTPANPGTLLQMMTPAQSQFFSMLGSNPQLQQLAFNMLMQGFLGDPSVAGQATFLKQQAAYKPKNASLYTNKFGLDLSAKPIQDITVHAKLGIYKAFGSQTDGASNDSYFADRVGAFDGTIGHIPTDSKLNVDRAYATWSNIADQPLWFSVGRRPSTNGAPSNLRLNKERPGNGGTPALLVDYAFDGMTIGYAPDIDMLPGAYAKVCYGRGFESGMTTPTNGLNDTDMLGIAILPIDTDPLRVWLQWNRGFDIFDFPSMNNTIFGNTAPAINLGSIDWYGAGAMSTLKNVGPGTLQLFGDLGLSVTHPNSTVSQNAGFQGLMSGEFFAQDFAPKDHTGWAVYAGVRYDLPSKTKIGFEFNHGSEYWITFAPAADDMWTSKVGTRGNVYEPYIIQELNLKPLSSYFAKAFVKLGYQYYDFEYTGSNNWVGAPKKISEIQPTDLMLMAPVKSAHNVYGTFEVQF